MTVSHRALGMMIGALSVLAASFAFLPPIAQDPRYHAFADQRTLYGVPNFWNVISNVPFFIVALYGLRNVRSSIAFTEFWERVAYGALLAGTAATGLGSSYYHLRPDDTRLFWDRLPMTVVFTSLLAATIGERVSMKAGKWLLLPLILLGIATVFYWRSSGDLRPYCVVQFGSMLAVPAMLVLFPPIYSGAGRVWCMLLLYALAKMMELLDQKIALVAPTGGHPWKHAAAAGAVFLYVIAVVSRQPLQPSLRALRVVPADGALQTIAGSRNEILAVHVPPKNISPFPLNHLTPPNPRNRATRVL